MDGRRRICGVGLLMKNKNRRFSKTYGPKVRYSEKTAINFNIYRIFFTAAIFFLIIFSSFAQDVAVTVNPEVIMSGIPFTVTFIVNYPQAEEVEITAPSFPPSIVMDRIVKYPWSSGGIRSQIQTVVEYRLIANTSGFITLNSFTIITPEGVTETGSFALSVQSAVPQQRNAAQRLYWDDVRSGAAAGDRITLVLRSRGNIRNPPPPSFFMPEVPRSVILTAQSVSPEEIQSGVMLKLLLIPLSAGDFILPARVLEYENTRFEIPAFSIRITGR